MTMFDITFPCEAVEPSGIPACSEGKMTATRKFAVNAVYAEELGLRLLGKWFDGATFTTPVLPATYPSLKFKMVAKSFTIDYLSKCRFQANPDLITDLVSTDQMETYYTDIEVDTEDTLAVVTVSYAEPDWDCDDAVEVLPDTAVSTQINPAYEMFTLPNQNLEWENPPGKDKMLKADSYAYKIIPKSDIIISWHNLPVTDLCWIETHLAGFRGKINADAWGDPIFCGLGSGSDTTCEPYPAETVMFIDFEEDRSKRTNGFIEMDTTTLKLHLKCRLIREGASTFGWNHLFCDKSGVGGVGSVWEKVKKNLAGVKTDLFETIAFSDLMYPTP